MMQHCVDQRSATVSRTCMNYHSGRFVQHYHVCVFIQDGERQFLWFRSQGRQVCWFDFDSFAGAQEMSRPSIGFTQADNAPDGMEAIRRLFSPEFRNRLDAVIQFAPLDPHTIEREHEDRVGPPLGACGFVVFGGHGHDLSDRRLELAGRRPEDRWLSLDRIDPVVVAVLTIGAQSWPGAAAARRGCDPRRRDRR